MKIPPPTPRGWSLIETLLALSITTFLSGAIYLTARNSTAAAHVKAETVNITDLASRIENSFSLVGNFSNVTTSRITGELLAPESMRSGNALWSNWGPVQVGPIADGGFQITYYSVPQEACTALASSVSNAAWGIDVNGTPVKAGGQNSFNPLLAKDNCTGLENEMVFIFGKEYAVGSYAGDPLDLPPSPTSVTPGNQSPETIIVGTPGDVADATVTPSIPPTQTGPVPTPPIPAPGVPTPSSPNPAPTPSTPSPSTPITVVSECQHGYEDRSAICSAGTWGSQVERQILACILNPGDDLVANKEAWIPWQAPNDQRLRLGWNINSGICTTCPSPAVENRNQWVAYTQNTCAAGTYGYTNWEREQGSQRTRSYNCPAGTTVLPAPDYTPWTAWVNTGNTRPVSNACTTCPGPSTGTQTQWVGYTAALCPAGQFGLTNRELEQAQNRPISFNCPAGTASLPAPTYGAWSAWSNTGNTRAVNNGTCSNCPAGSSQNETQWVGYTANNCPAGQYGYSNREQEQSRNRGISYNCPAGTTSIPAPTYGGWSAWVNTGSTRAVNSVCNNCPAGSTQSTSQWIAASAACPASAPDGVNTWEKEQSATRSVSYNCPAGTASIPAATYGGWGAWSDTGNTRNVVNTCSTGLTGICPSEPLTVACATYNNSGVRITAIDFDTEGAGFTRGEYVRCTIGYRNQLSADGFPTIGSDWNKFILRQRGNGALTDWENEWSYEEDSSSYIRIFAKKADGTQGNQCYGEQKVSFNYDGK